MLRWRLLIGIVTIVVLLLAAGGYTIWLLMGLEKAIDSILTENYESIRSAHSIRISVLRMNAFYFREAPDGFQKLGTEPMETRFVPPLEHATTALQLLAKSPEETAAVDKLKEQLSAYLEAFRKGFDINPRDEEAFQTFRENLLAQNLAMTETTERILKLSEDEMMRSQQRSNRLVIDTVRFLAVSMIVAMAVLVYTYLKLGRSLITPIEDLRRSIEAVKLGNFEQTIPVKSTDELGELSRSFNEMSGELREFRREADETILRLNRSLRETIAAFPYPVILLDADNAIWVTNVAAEKFLAGIGVHEQLPFSLTQRLDEVRLRNRDYLPDGLDEAMLFRIDDREVHFLPRMLRVFSPEGAVSGTAVILIDVSRFRWLDDMKTNLISTVSHEIKTPLTGIRMILHLLKEKSCGSLNDMQDEMVASACDDCERLLSTLNSLLELSRIEAGRTHLDLKSVPPRDILEEASAVFQTQAENRHIRFSIACERDLPEILVDRARIMHVLGNFVSNALKFAPEGSIVGLTADRPGGDYVRLSVVDSGPGIPEQYHARIFDKFFRPPAQKADGVGLGLSIAREIVHAHDGHIGFTSDPGITTRFYCELPIA